MELDHRFEVPVGIDRAWTHLLDMELVAACFPGATLTSADGSEYTGSVKVKLGPIQLTYKGAARIVSADEATHTATIEASGTAARSGSTATMKVVAAAEAVSESVTAVSMKTDLAITGRPAQFGRGVMAEVGDKILGQFAACLATNLAAAEAGVDGKADNKAAKAPDKSAKADAGAAAGADATGDTGGAGATAEPRAANESGAAGTTSGARYTRAPEPIDLLESARGSIIKRLVPLAVGLVVLCVIWRWRKRSKSA